MRKPKRIQLRRKKGWRKPSDAVVCSRPSKFGNPFTRTECRAAGYTGTDDEIAARCVEAFRAWLTSPHWRENWSGEESERRRTEILESLDELRGKDLCCWCPIGRACHVDVLLDLANR